MCPLLALIWPWAPFGGSSWDHEICRIGSKANMYKYVIPSGNSRVCSRTSLFFIGKSSSFSMGHFPSNKWYSPAFNSSSISCSHPFNYFYGSLPIDHSWKTPYLNIFNGKKTWFPVNFPKQTNPLNHAFPIYGSMDQWINKLRLRGAHLLQEPYGSELLAPKKRAITWGEKRWEKMIVMSYDDSNMIAIWLYDRNMRVIWYYDRKIYTW